MGIRAERRKKWAETAAREKAEREEREAKKSDKRMKESVAYQSIEAKRKAAIFMADFQKKNGRNPTDAEVFAWVCKQ